MRMVIGQTALQYHGGRVPREESARRIPQTIYYDVLAYRETPRANAKVVVARAAQVGMACKKEKSVGDGIDQAVGDFKATALFGDVIPDIVQVGGGLRRYAVRHQRGAGCSLARRAWPRCFTSSASSRIDCCVMVRPSPRAREALASSRVAKNSARLRSRSSHRDNASCTASSTR